MADHKEVSRTCIVENSLAVMTDIINLTFEPTEHNIRNMSNNSIDMPEVVMIPKSTPNSSRVNPALKSNKSEGDLQIIGSGVQINNNNNQLLEDSKNTSSSSNYNVKDENQCAVLRKHKLDSNVNHPDSSVMNDCSPSKIPKIESTLKPTSFINLSNSTITSSNRACDNIDLSFDDRPRPTAENPIERVLTPKNLKNPQIYYQVLDIFPDVEKNYLTDLCNTGSNLIEVINIILEGNNDNSEVVPIGIFQQTPNEGGHLKVSDSQQFPNEGEHLKGVDLSKDIVGFKNCSDVIPIKPTNHDSDSNGNEKQQKPTVSFENSQLEFLTHILPDAAPSYLLTKSTLTGAALWDFINEAMEKKNYPKQTLNRPTEKKAESSEDDIGLYTTAFNIENFVQLFPEPFKYFTDENRICTYSEHAYEFLKRMLRNHSIKLIHMTYKKHNYNMTKTYEELENQAPTRTTRRPLNEIRMPTQKNLPFLQEACFLEHKGEIKSYIDSKAEVKRLSFEQAKERGELVTCGCCFDEAVFEDCRTCNEGDLFCKDCIKKSVEVRIGDGHNTFPCLEDCGSEFSLQLLQSLLDANMFSKLLKRIQLEEVRAADIEGLEVCPFCEFATIPPPETSVFNCLNPECLKESCRKCHRLSHIPQRCEELENDDQARARKYIEDEMTKALVRECYKCKKSFIKVEGCNKMTCTCGARMCYICRQPVVDYKHFNGPGGAENKKCPLYSTDKVLHEDAVKVFGENALKTITETNPTLQLKHDPTKMLPTTHAKSLLPNGMQEDAAALIQRLQQPPIATTTSGALQISEPVVHPLLPQQPARPHTPPPWVPVGVPRYCNAAPNVQRPRHHTAAAAAPQILNLARHNVQPIINRNAPVPNVPLNPPYNRPYVPRGPNNNPLPHAHHYDYAEQLQQLDDMVEHILAEMQQDADS